MNLNELRVARKTESSAKGVAQASVPAKRAAAGTEARATANVNRNEVR